MSKLWVVNRAAGTGWDAARKVTEQEDWPAHAALMDAMHADGFVLLAGPISGTPSFEAMMVVRAETEGEVRERFAPDPWVVKDISRIVRVVRWHVRLGAL
jgi:uncharacterized protein YciI